MGEAAAIQCQHCNHSNPLGSLQCHVCHTPFHSDDQTLTGAIVVTPAATPEPGMTRGVAGATNWSGATPAPEPGEVSFEPGSIVAGRYEIESMIGEGGMGTVYKALDRELDRTVALKVIRPELAGNSEILSRFKQELILARQITHRNVIRIFDLGATGHVRFITMEYVEGEDLHALQKKKRFSIEEAINIARQVCGALEAAHAESVIHRDLKPHNIMIGAKGKASVMDFGLARTFESTGMTQAGLVLGTPAYMSPEQAQGQPADHRSDIFALGIVFYELLTGVTPFKAETTLATLLKRTQGPPPPPSELNRAATPDIDAVVAKALAINLAERYQSASEFMADLNVLAGHTSGKSSPSALTSASAIRALSGREPAPPVAFWRRKQLYAVAALVVVLAAAALYVTRSRPSPVARSGKPVSVLVADFENHTGDGLFDETLEPMVNLALEGASFINAFNRGQARTLAAKLPNPKSKLDEQSARLIAAGQGIAAVITGSLSRRGNNYKLSMEALDALTGNSLAKTEATAGSKDALLVALPKAVAPIRKALGDTAPESAQITAAAGGFTAASLEVVHQYGVGMEQMFAGKWADAFRSFSKAAELDPNFARAYSGMAAVAGNMGHAEESLKYAKLAMEHVDRMTDRERYRILGMYFVRTGNWEKCIEQYSQLVEQFPVDNIGHNNLSVCYAHVHDMSKAMQMAERAMQISPKDVMARNNVALWAVYGGQFDRAEQEARELRKDHPSLESAYLLLGYAQTGRGQLDQAAQVYSDLAKSGARGASLAAAGLANLAIYEGRLSDAAQSLEKGIAADLGANERDAAADKYVMLAHAQALRGARQAAVAAAERAIANSKSDKIRFLAARAMIDAGETAKAQAIASALAADLKADPQAYAKLLQGEIALKQNKAQQALQFFKDAKKLNNFWFSALGLGRAYLEAGAFAEADSEFEACIKRRGEAMEIFMDDMPTSAYVPPVYYYQGRAREGLKSAGSADSYRKYLDVRGKAGEDPLLPDVRRRIGG